MVRYKEIKKKIQNKHKELPKSQRKIADYFVDNFDKVPFLNVHDISLKTNTSVASVVRFAQRIGFSGFNELREAIAESLQNHLSNFQTFPLFDKRNVEKDILTSVANLDVKNINETLNLIDRGTFNYVIDRISKSERVFTAGLGISYLLAEILAYQLTQVGISSSVLQHSHTLFNEHILFLNQKDLLIVFSFPPYSKETIEAAEFAHKRKIHVISITNKYASPVTLFTKENLIVKSENMLFTNSFAAISVLINAIATACAIKDKQRAKNVLKESEEIMINQKQIIRES